ncbi:P-loop containing nucleoside triphosphate hydrolase protein [Tribonema minus]|uniref:Kinesin-like protein n=1 Tax=Tribonema minus TaxID=303371 RepID=A0A835YWQ8_9STRA|nr:P-loop containing nucleoside triphosphate hydrolase protein [Tribonema minus]
MSGEASNVRVAVRCRPMSAKEEAMGCKPCVSLHGATVTITPPSDSSEDRAKEAKSFTYDHAFGDESTQAGVYEALGQPIVGQALQGYNVTIFAYGQTGSGKSHTMMGGSGDSAGIIPLLNKRLFEAVGATTSAETKFMLTVSYLEVYNEVIHDLLNPVKEKMLRIREHPDLGIYVEGLCELVVHTADDVLKLIEQGGAVRRVAATNMNERSSRSHSCFSVKLAQKTTQDVGGGIARETVLNSKLNLVDLAGSERAKKTGASGDTLREGASINKSLMCLGNVITALSEGKKRGHIPYRDSTLTRLLQESLGGNARTLMIAAVSPADYNCDETLSTLRYAHRAKSIENSVTKNEDVNEKMIRELKMEIEKLRAQLMGGLGGSSGGSGGGDDAELLSRLQSLQSAQQQTWEEKERLSKQLEAERANNVTAAIGQAVDDVKHSKLETMKAIKRLQKTKEGVAKRQKALRTQYDRLKDALQASMDRYQAAQAQYDQLADGDAARAPLEGELAGLLDAIESQRADLLACRADVDKAKKEAKRVEEKLAEERAELVASNGLLEQNARLRAAIAAEEREKFAGEKDAYLREALAAERINIAQQAAVIERSIDEVREAAQLREAELSFELKEARRECEERAARQAALQAEIEDLTNQVAESEVALEAAQSEAAEARDAAATAAATAAAAAASAAAEAAAAATTTSAGAAVRGSGDSGGSSGGGGGSGGGGCDEESYRVFKGLMVVFEDERRGWEARHESDVGLLRSALGDVLHLQARCAALEAQLQRAILWEADARLA